jgi:CRP/FNR family transcriptional regulator
LSKINNKQLNKFKQVMQVKGPVRRGETIYRAGMPVKSIFFIRKGSVKTEVCTVNGLLEVTAFYLVGELLGVDAIGSEEYPADAVAMEDTWLCELPISQLKALCRMCDEFQQALITRLGRTLNEDVYQWALARNQKAKQKVAWFIFGLFKRISLRQIADPLTIPLPMRKTDIANYLGLAPESLSRALHALEEEGVILNHSKHIYVSDIKKAQDMSTI